MPALQWLPGAPAPQAAMAVRHMHADITICTMLRVILTISLTCQHPNGLQACLPHREAGIFPPHAPVCVRNHHLAHLQQRNKQAPRKGTRKVCSWSLQPLLSAAVAPVACCLLLLRLCSCTRSTAGQLSASNPPAAHMYTCVLSRSKGARTETNSRSTPPSHQVNCWVSFTHQQHTIFVC
jgi:hypothetical protein